MTIRAVLLGCALALVSGVAGAQSEWPAGKVTFDDADTLQYKFDNSLLGAAWTANGATVGKFFTLDPSGKADGSFGLLLNSYRTGANALAIVDQTLVPDEVFAWWGDYGAYWSRTSINLAGSWHASVDPDTGLVTADNTSTVTVPDGNRSDGFDHIPMILLQPDVETGFLFRMGTQTCTACDTGTYDLRGGTNYSTPIAVYDDAEELAWGAKWNGKLFWADAGASPGVADGSGTPGAWDAIDVVLAPTSMGSTGFLTLTNDFGETDDTYLLTGLTDYTTGVGGLVPGDASLGTDIFTAGGWIAAGGADTTAIHDDTSGEIAAVAEKASPVSGDLLLIEDSAAGNVKKRVQIGNLPGGGSVSQLTDLSDVGTVLGNTTVLRTSVNEDGTTGNAVCYDANDNLTDCGAAPGGGAGADTTAIHDDTSGEIAAVAEKTDPVGADLILIEDSESSNAKKKVQLANLNAAQQNDLGTDPAGPLVAGDIDGYVEIIFTDTGSTGTLTLPTPTQTTPHLLMCTNSPSSTERHSCNGIYLAIGESALFYWDGSAWGQRRIAPQVQSHMVARWAAAGSSLADATTTLGAIGDRYMLKSNLYIPAVTDDLAIRLDIGNNFTQIHDDSNECTGGNDCGYFAFKYDPPDGKVRSFWFLDTHTFSFSQTATVESDMKTFLAVFSEPANPESDVITPTTLITSDTNLRGCSAGGCAYTIGSTANQLAGGIDWQTNFRVASGITLQPGQVIGWLAKQVANGTGGDIEFFANLEMIECDDVTCHWLLP